MDTGHPHAKALFAAIGITVMACLFACPAFAGDNIVQVVPLFSDGRGNQAWVEIVSTGTRMKATPFVADGGRNLRDAAGNPEGEKEPVAVSLPISRISNLVDKVRRAIRDMKRPAAQRPSDPGALPAVAAADPSALPAVAAEPAGPVGEPSKIATR